MDGESARADWQMIPDQDVAVSVEGWTPTK
jgi:hypothetical protein